MKRPLPNNPLSPPPAESEGSFDNFAQNTAFLKHVLHPDMPEPGSGVHVPVWLSPKLAQEILAAHGKTGHAVPHPNIDLKRLDR